MVIGSPNVNPGYRLMGNWDYPEIADDFVKIVGILKALRRIVRGSGGHARTRARRGLHSRGDLGPPLVQPVSRFQMRTAKAKPNPRQVTPMRA